MKILDVIVSAAIGAAFVAVASAQVIAHGGKTTLDPIAEHFANLTASSDSARWSPLIGDVSAGKVFRSRAGDTTFVWMDDGRELFTHPVAIYLDANRDYNGVDIVRDVFIYANRGADNYGYYVADRPSGVVHYTGAGTLLRNSSSPDYGVRRREVFRGTADSTYYYRAGKATDVFGSWDDDDSLRFGVPIADVSSISAARTSDTDYFRLAFDSTFVDGDEEKWLRYGVAPTDAFAIYDFHVEADSVVDHRGTNPLAIVRDSTPTNGSGFVSAANTNRANDTTVARAAATLTRSARVAVVR
jgi:hypothetical protein